MSDYVAFALDGATYAVEAAVVDEVQRMVWLTPVAGAPDDVCGVCTVRGEHRVILDVAARLGGRRRDPEPTDYLVFLAVEDAILGLRVDGIDGLVSGTLEAAPPGSRPAPYVAGYLADGVHPVAVLDLSAMLEPEIRELLADVAGNAPEPDAR